MQVALISIPMKSFSSLSLIQYHQLKLRLVCVHNPSIRPPPNIQKAELIS